MVRFFLQHPWAVLISLSLHGLLVVLTIMEADVFKAVGTQPPQANPIVLNPEVKVVKSPTVANVEPYQASTADMAEVATMIKQIKAREAEKQRQAEAKQKQLEQETQRLAAQKAAERVRLEKLKQEQAAQEKLAKEKAAAAEKARKEAAAALTAAKKAEQEKLAKEKAAEEVRLQAEKEKLRLEKEAKERALALQAEQEKIEASVEKQRKEAELKRLLEQERQAELEAKRQTQLSALKDAWKLAIIADVELAWRRPIDHSGKRYQTEVLITQDKQGNVLSVKVLKPPVGAPVNYLSSVEEAIYRASPLPLPSDPEIFERQIRFIFKK